MPEVAERRPALELADVVSKFGDDPQLRARADHRKAMNAIASCRTAALGGHVERCDGCGHRRIAYNSCRNRHCPKCQGSACARWMAKREKDLLPVEYFHVVFTLPDDFNALAIAQPCAVYDALFDAASQALLEVAANPRRLGAKLGLIAVLHTWGQNLTLHPHVHCVVPGGGTSPDGSRWVSCRRGFLLPVKVLSRVFRGKFVDLLRRRLSAAPSPRFDIDDVERTIARAIRREWVVYAKPPFGGPAQVLRYLARYTHRIAIGNRRLLAMDDRTVTFRWKDYAHGNQPKTMTLDGVEFLRRFLLHVVPRGFVRIRHYGLLANRDRTARIERCRALIAEANGDADAEPVPIQPATQPDSPASSTIDDVNGTSPAARHCPRCPHCGGRLSLGARLTPPEVAYLLRQGWDTS